jgi:hypothetical protein
MVIFSSPLATVSDTTCWKALQGGVHVLAGHTRGLGDGVHELGAVQGRLLKWVTAVGAAVVWQQWVRQRCDMRCDMRCGLLRPSVAQQCGASSRSVGITTRLRRAGAPGGARPGASVRTASSSAARPAPAEALQLEQSGVRRGAKLSPVRPAHRTRCCGRSLGGPHRSGDVGPNSTNEGVPGGGGEVRHTRVHADQEPGGRHQRGQAEQVRAPGQHPVGPRPADAATSTASSTSAGPPVTRTSWPASIRPRATAPQRSAGQCRDTCAAPGGSASPLSPGRAPVAGPAPGRTGPPGCRTPPAAGTSAGPRARPLSTAARPRARTTPAERAASRTAAPCSGARDRAG